MKVAVIGAGVSGLGAAYALKDTHDLVVYEKDGRLGGHANTATIDYDGREIDVDTGFIVYNARNYPNLVGLLDTLGVESVQTDMSFAFASKSLEWSSNFPKGVFAQKRNLLNPRFLRMLSDIRRFNETALDDLNTGRLTDLTLSGYLHLRGFSPTFQANYLLPMGAAIWSTSEHGIGDVPAESFVRFFYNHNLLQMVQPTWRTIKGGSRQYVSRIEAMIADRVRGAATQVKRRPRGGVAVTGTNGEVDHFDHVILACHSDQALGLLADADIEERAFIGAIRYSQNTAYLHRDTSLMPKRRNAWGSWNYLIDPKTQEPNGVTYWMNSLQAIDNACPLFVSLNPSTPPAPELTFGAYDYEHPQFDTPSLAAQRRFSRIQGRGGVWYAGAWLGYGFHEDGLTSGLRAALALGGSTPWTFVDHRIEGGPLSSPVEAERLRVRA